MINNSLKKKIGQMIMLCASNEPEPGEFTRLCKEYKIGNFELHSRNCVTYEMLCDFTDKLRNLTYNESGIYPFICIDQEGGWVTRYYEGAAMLSGAMSYAASGADGKSMFKVGQRIGNILRALGCNMTTSPVLDVNVNPKNPIICTRSYGDDPERVAELGTGFATGIESTGVISTVKHYPGHGNVHGDTHLETTHNSVDRDTLMKTEFVPFQRAFDAGVGGLMTAHVTYDAFSNLPATVSYEIMTELLRGEMNFDGVAITDAMGMKAINDLYPKGESSVQAILAGCDMLLYYSQSLESVEEAILAVYSAVEDGRISEERINESYERILRQKAKYSVADCKADKELAYKLIFSKEDIAENFADKCNAITCLKHSEILENLKDMRVLCIAPVCEALRSVEEKHRQILSFADIFAREFPCTTACVSSLKGMTDEVMEAISGEYDVVVLGIFRADLSPRQLEILNELERRGKTVIAALLGSPYDMKHTDGCEAVVCSYEYTTLSTNALVKCMKDASYKGQLPVAL